MQEINLVIAELQLVLVMLDAKTPDKKRVQTLLDQALADLTAAAKSISGHAAGGGDTEG